MDDHATLLIALTAEDIRSVRLPEKTAWATCKMHLDDLDLSPDDIIERFVRPAIMQIWRRKTTPAA